MECREAERLVKTFIEDKMAPKEMEKFLEHIEHCESCKEELSIQFLVAEGMLRLEEGNTFDLQSELLHRLELAKKRIQRRNVMKRVVYYAELAAIGIILILTILVVLL